MPYQHNEYDVKQNHCQAYRVFSYETLKKTHKRLVEVFEKRLERWLKLPEINHHQKVLEITSLSDTSSTDNIIESYLGDIYYGSIDYYFMTTSTEIRNGYIALKSNYDEVITIYTESNEWKYGDNSILEGFGKPQNNTWQYIRIDFCLDAFQVGGEYLGLKSNNFRFRIIARTIFIDKEYDFKYIKSLNSRLLFGLITFLKNLSAVW